MKLDKRKKITVEDLLALDNIRFIASDFLERQAPAPVERVIKRCR